MIKFSEKFKLFSNTEIGSVRMLPDQDGNPWFVANDVCKILEIANSRDAMTRLDEYEKFAVGLTDAGKTLADTGFDITRVRTVNLVNELWLIKGIWFVIIIIMSWTFNYLWQILFHTRLSLLTARLLCTFRLCCNKPPSHARWNSVDAGA